MSWVAVGVGAVGVIGSVGGGLMSSSKSSKSSRHARKSQEKMFAQQMNWLRQVRSDIADAVDEGVIDLNEGYNMAVEQMEPFTGMEEYNAARDLLSNPDAIMDRPGTQFQFAQGQEAIQGAFSRTSGGGLSGTALKAATEYGQNFASTALDDELNRLFPFINMSMQARTNIANTEMNRGTGLANLKVGGATGKANITGQMLPQAMASLDKAADIRYADGMNQANNISNMFSNVTSQVGNMMGTYAKSKQ